MADYRTAKERNKWLMQEAVQPLYLVSVKIIKKLKKNAYQAKKRMRRLKKIRNNAIKQEKNIMKSMHIAEEDIDPNIKRFIESGI